MTFTLGQQVQIHGTCYKDRTVVQWTKPWDLPRDWDKIRALPAADPATSYDDDGYLTRTTAVRTTIEEHPNSQANSKTVGIIVGIRSRREGLLTEIPYDQNTFTIGATKRVYLVATDLHRKIVECLPNQIEALPTPELITIPAPHVPYPGPDNTDASFMRTAARNIKNGFPVGGYNLTTAVIKLLTDTANALENQK